MLKLKLLYSIIKSQSLSPPYSLTLRGREFMVHLLKARITKNLWIYLKSSYIMLIKEARHKRVYTV